MSRATQRRIGRAPGAARHVLAAGALLLAAGCGADPDGDDAPSPEPTSSPATLPSAVPFTGKPTPIAEHVAHRFEIAGGPDWLAAGAGALWVKTDAGPDPVRVDPEAGKVTARVARLDNARAIAAGTEVWVGFAGGVASIDAGTATVTVADAHPGMEAGIAVAPDAVWVRADGDFLRRVRPQDGHVLADITAPEQSGGSVLVAFGSVWATAFDDDVLYRLSAT